MEPTYEYVKGEGWVINPGRIHTFACGTKARLELKIPLKGERFRYSSGDWDMDRWVLFFTESETQFRYTDTASCDDPHSDYRKGKSNFYCVVTVVP